MKKLLLFCLLFTACSQKPLPVLGQVDEFELTDQKAAKFDSDSLRGHVWVADFIYTTCPGPCPRMSSHMRSLQNISGPDVRLISFSVDPEHDTPPVLEEYAKKFGADEKRWTFLTGPKDAITTLGRDQFKVGAGVDHSTYFVLLDKKGRIRGYYGISDGNPAERLAKDAARLEQEPA
jgi:protein SCO1/2